MGNKFQRAFSSTIVLLLLAILVLGGYVLWTQYPDLLRPDQPQRPSEERGITPTTPEDVEPEEEPRGTPKPIKQGTETYNISQAQSARPKITQATFNPHDPDQGQTQEISIRVLDSAPVNSVSVSIESDNNSRNINLTLSEGNNQDGVWTGSWEVDDSVDYTYIVTVTASGAGGQSSVEIGMRRE